MGILFEFKISTAVFTHRCKNHDICTDQFYNISRYWLLDPPSGTVQRQDHQQCYVSRSVWSKPSVIRSNWCGMLDRKSQFVECLMLVS